MAIFANLQLKNEISLVSISDPATELVCESVLLKISLKKFNLYIMGIYRSPLSNLEESLDVISAELDKIHSLTNPIVIMGDINVDSLENTTNKQMLSEVLEGYNIKRLKLPPTRITHHSQTSIDFICTNLDEANIAHSVLTTGLSDHSAQACSIETYVDSYRTKTMKRNINNQTMEEVRSILAAQDWTEVITLANTDDAYDAFSAAMRFALDTACPYKVASAKTKKVKKVWDDECSALKKSFIEALNKEILTGNINDKRETAMRKKQYDLKLKDLRKKVNSDFIEQAQNTSKALWQVINSERKEKTTSTHLESLNIDGDLSNSPESMANYLNSFFVTIADKTLQQNKIEDRGTTTITTQNRPIANLQFYRTTEEEVKNIIQSMKPKTSAGEDDISLKLIKHCKEEIITPITSIINCSLNNGTFPQSLKVAKVYPKHKNGPTTEVSNYRPISLTSNFSKIIERVVLNRLTEHLKQHSILTPNQHGFIRNRSTTTAITQLIDSIIDKLDKGYVATSILLDFSKAFDCLDHKLLIEKLKRLGITGKEALWFESYLSNRTQLVELTYKENQTIFKTKSQALPLSRGVPQGSVLGPVLYILLTNDLPKYLEDFCETVMFADDTALIIANKSKEELEVDSYTAYNMAKQYCCKNDLVLNEKKTYQLIFTPNTNMLAGLPELTTVTSQKYLGITLDNNLSWTTHVEELCKKLNTSLYAIRRMKQISDIKTTMTAYFSLFESHIRYGLLAWGGTSATNLKKVLVIQKRAIRTIKGLNPQDSCREAFKELKILSVTGLYILETVLYTVKSGQTRLGFHHAYNTRHRHNFTLDPHHLSLFEKKPSYRGAAFFNCLPESMKRLPIRNLKTSLKTWLLDHPIYSLQELQNLTNTTQ